MKLKPPINPNYCGTVVAIRGTHALPGCDNVIATGIFGNNVIVGKDTHVDDLGVFFPVETRLSDEFLSKNNLFRHAERNSDPTKKGYFEDNGRVRAMKFRGHKSEGFFVPLSYFSHFDPPELKVGDEFDHIGDVKICEKYVVVFQRVGSGGGKKKQKRAEKISRLVENQFRLHYDTAQLAKNMHKLSPETIISISAKFHGTSWVVGNVLVKRRLSWKEKIAKWFGVRVQETEYDVIFSSRKVIKGAHSLYYCKTSSLVDRAFLKPIRKICIHLLSRA